MTKLYGLILGVISIFLIFGGCQKKEEKQEQDKKVIIRPVKVKTIRIGGVSSSQNTFSGIAKGLQESVLSFRVPGVVEQLNFEVGHHVKSGQVAAVLDDRDFKIQVQNISSQLKAGQAQLRQLKKGARAEDIRILENQIRNAKSAAGSTKTGLDTANKEFQRISQLYSKQIASKSQYDQAQNTLVQAKSQLEQARQNVVSAEKELEKARAGGREEEVDAQQAQIRSIRSNLEQAKASLNDTRLNIPYDGVISKKYISSYEQVGAGNPIYSVVDISKVEIQISIPEVLISNLSNDQPITVKFLNFPGKIFKGKITKMGISADPQTLTFPVFVEIENRSKTILPGMSANVSLKIAGQGSAYPLIPIHSILQDKVNQTRFVWKFDAKNSVANKQIVSLGRLREQEVEVINGLRDGDIIIVAGVHRVTEGLTVRVLGRKK